MNRKRKSPFIFILLSVVLGYVMPLKSQTRPKEVFNDQAFKADLKGAVKSQLLTVIVDSGLPALRDVGEQAYVLQERYNNNQMRTLEELYNLEKVAIGKSEILHDRNGFKTEVLYTDLFEDVLNRITYEYDKNGNWKRVTNYDGYYNPLEIFYYDFTPKNQISEIRKTNEDGTILERTVFLYDSLGNNVERITYDKNGVELLDTEYLFNQKGNVISYREFDADQNIREFYEAEFSGDTTLVSTTIEIYNDKKPAASVKYEFDPLGNILKRTDKDLTGTKPDQVRTFIYEWDLNGNWTKQVILQDGKERVAATREITYYQ
ncbi:MAG: hypothetical protein RR202_02200 [Bacteroidales bacterium]